MLSVLDNPSKVLRDEYGRGVGYLRLSLTKACSMRCTYCRPAFVGQPRGESVLSVREIEQLVRHLANRHGLRKVRLTGGDPTSRADLADIIAAVAGVLKERDEGRGMRGEARRDTRPFATAQGRRGGGEGNEGKSDLAMTTNGLTLAHRAREYADAGLGRVNISLDTLNAERFARMTGVDGLARVLAGLDAAQRVGFWPIKLNTVVLRGQNEADLPDLLRFAVGRGLELRFIELMPMGPLADRWAQRYVPESAMRRGLETIVEAWHPLEQGHDAARRYRVTLDTGETGVVGFITPMSCNFCASCNRIRIAADGAFYPCLMDEPRGSILPALRPRFDGEQLDAILSAGLASKRAEHPHDGFITMTHIGG